MASPHLARETAPAAGARALHVRPPSRALVAAGERLGRLASPTLRVAGRTWPAYGVFVSSGVIVGAGWAVALAAWTGRSPLRALALMLAGLATALALAFATRAATGRERFTFHHYQLAVLGVGSGLLAVFGWPVLVGLDLLAVALAVTLAVGRLGCLSVGCCHGRPAPWGIRYRDEHAASGFPAALVGVALWPVAPVESVGVGLLAVSASALVLSERTAGRAGPGTALTLTLGGYAILRFLLERVRGDERPRLAGLSEAQWTALAALASLSGLGAAGVLAIGDRAVASAVLALTALVAVALVDAWRSRGGLFSGAHETEIAGLLSSLARTASHSTRVVADGAIEVRTTSRRVRLSTGVLGSSRLVSFSMDGGSLPTSLAAALGRRLLAWSDAGFGGELVEGSHGVWHLLVPGTPAGHEG